jgi:two-component system response regulator PhoP
MSRHFSVLIVEDDDPLRQCLMDLLAEEGWMVHATGSGREAVELARKHALDFGLVDLHLPGISGLDVIRTIAREIRPVPSIMMSGQATGEEARIAAAERTVFRFLRKPLDLQHLRWSMDLLIQHHFGPRSGPPRA